MSEIIQVVMADMKIANAPSKLVTLGLGSCIGICAYDSQVKVGGLAHIMLPTSQMATDQKINRDKFADTAVPKLIDQMEQTGAARGRLVIKIVGGAHMFSVNNDSILNIGARNIVAVEEAFRKLGLEIQAKSVGGNVGKSVTLDLDNGTVKIKAINIGEVFL